MNESKLSEVTWQAWLIFFMIVGGLGGVVYISMFRHPESNHSEPTARPAEDYRQYLTVVHDDQHGVTC